MSKQHQASRRRTYGRRQHELHERTERPAGFLGWLEGPRKCRYRKIRAGSVWSPRCRSIASLARGID